MDMSLGNMPPEQGDNGHAISLELEQVPEVREDIVKLRLQQNLVMRHIKIIWMLGSCQIDKNHPMSLEKVPEATSEVVNIWF